MYIRSLAVVLAIATTAVTSAPASAQVFCSEPLSPFCLDDRTVNRDALNVARCKQSVEDFAAKVTEYLACLDESAETLKASVAEMRRQIEELEAEVESETELPPEE